MNRRKSRMLNIVSLLLLTFICLMNLRDVFAQSDCREEKRQQETQELEQQFSWWPTDAQPAPVKDEQKGGYWWWPQKPGQAEGPLWGNRGYCYVAKVIFDYKEEELPPAKPQEMRPSLVIKKVIKNIKIYFDFNKSEIRDDAAKILKQAAATMKRNPEADILVTGNCDIRGSEKYNDKLGRARAASVEEFLISEGISNDKIRIVSRGKLDAVAPVSDLVGMQKDRNAQFMIAEVEEVMIPYEGGASTDNQLSAAQAMESSDGQYVIQEESTAIEGEIKVKTKDYTVQKNDSLWKIAQNELGSGHRWKYLYELNKDRISNPNKLKTGSVILIPIE